LLPRISARPSSNNKAAYNHLIAIALAISLVAGIDLLTPHQSPIADAVFYVNIAKHGIIGNNELAAPYAYRPAVPLVAGTIARIMGITYETAFVWIARVSAVTLLCLACFLARSIGATFLHAVAVMCVVAFSLFHVRYPLYLPTMVDVEAVAMITLAVWLILRRRYLLGFFVCSAGLFFKEFLAIPSVLLVVQLTKEYFRERSERHLLLYALLASVTFALCFLVPRLTFPVRIGFGSNLQFVLDAAQPSMYMQNLRTFLSGPFDLYRNVNILFALASYWLPVLILLSPPRIRTIRESLADDSSTLVLFMILLLVLTMVGGTNIMIFVTYGVPLLVIVLALALRNASIVEIVFVVVVTFIFNRIWVQLPLMSSDIAGSMDVYGGWDSRLNETTLYRTLEMTGYVFSAIFLRRLLRTSGARQGKKQNEATSSA
jgi:hypothetical protein